MYSALSTFNTTTGALEQGCVFTVCVCVSSRCVFMCPLLCVCSLLCVNDVCVCSRCECFQSGCVCP